MPTVSHFPTSATTNTASGSLTSVPQDALDAVFGPALVLLQLLLLDFVLVLLVVAFHPELSPHDATDGADCKRFGGRSGGKKDKQQQQQKQINDKKKYGWESRLLVKKYELAV